MEAKIVSMVHQVQPDILTIPLPTTKALKDVMNTALVNPLMGVLNHAKNRNPAVPINTTNDFLIVISIKNLYNPC